MAGTNSLSADWEVNAIISIFLYNQILDNYLCFRGKVQRFHAMKSKWGLTKFISKKSLTDPSNGFLVDDNCVFGAEVFVIKSPQVMTCVSVLKPNYRYNRDWKISNFSKLKGNWGLERKAILWKKEMLHLHTASTQSTLPRTMALLPADDDEYSMETRHAPPSHLLIKIASFSLLLEYGIQHYESREFAAGDYKWKLIIYPNRDYISADLAMVRTSSLPLDWEVNAIFSIFLYNQILDNYLCFRGNVRRFHALKSKWGLFKLISKKSLKDPSNGFLVDDNCVFGAEVFVIKRQLVTECVSLLKATDASKHDWKISNFSKLKGVWSSEEFTAGGHKWKIILYPNGNVSEEGRSVSIFLCSVDSQRFAPHEKLKANFCLRIKNQLHDKHRSCSTSIWFDSYITNRGWHAFISIGDVRDSSKGFIVNDCCFLETEISVQAVARNAP